MATDKTSPELKPALSSIKHSLRNVRICGCIASKGTGNLKFGESLTNPFECNIGF